MKIQVNHLTKMSAGYICAGGIDPATKKHVRPTILGRLPASLLRVNGGPFEIGSIVDLGSTTPVPQNPEVEDHRFVPSAAKSTGFSSPAAFWASLAQMAKPKLSELFGADLKMLGSSACGVDAHKGSASLGVWSPKNRPELVAEPDGKSGIKLRVKIQQGEHHLNLSVTDIRFYSVGTWKADEAAILRAQKHLASGEEIYLSVGLTRSWSSSPDFPPVHWLQINNIHFESNPTWQLGTAL